MAEETFPDPTEDEFATWLRPPEALAELSHLGKQTAVTTLLARLEADLARGAAGIGRWVRQGTPRTIERMTIPGEWWAKAYLAKEAHRAFWTVGDLTIDLAGGRDGTIKFSLFDVRFDPFGVYAIGRGGIAPSASAVQERVRQEREAGAATVPPPSSGKADSRPKIDFKTLKAWVADYGARNPGTSFAVFRDNARLAFPQFRVTERPVERAIAELGLKLSVGNPLILRKQRRIGDADLT